MSKNKIYDAAIYVRLSKEDGDKIESDSIVNQKELIRDYLKSMPDIRICSERVDDGYSGVDFLRPSFIKMMEDIKAGKINCVIVKDFSRFGRNYIEVGKYLEHVFPFLGVRFISVNDRYDSVAKRTSSDELIVPFKNLVNDLYCRDISVKIRSQLEVKCKKGDFIGAFAVYGYLKSPENKNKLVIDEYASEIVKDIFKWKLDGMSQQGIADRLNEQGVLSPMEYKRKLGMKYSTSFKVNNKAVWSAVTVGRILKNPVYIGVLEQGKVSTPNYKVKCKAVKPQDQWIITENTHEAIISKEMYDLVNQVMKSDTRITPGGETVYKFSGVLYCGDCKNTMCRKTIRRNGKSYIYYVCSTKKNGQGCSFHNFSEIELEKVVMSSIKAHIKTLLDMEQILAYINSLSYKEREMAKVKAGIAIQEEDVEKYKKMKLSVYEDFKDGILDQYDYEAFSAIYTEKLNEAKRAVTKLKTALELIFSNESGTNQLIEHFKKYQDIDALDRKIIVSLIQQIVIYENNKVEITFLYNDKYEILLKAVQNVCKTQSFHEEVVPLKAV